MQTSSFGEVFSLSFNQEYFIVYGANLEISQSKPLSV